MDGDGYGDNPDGENPDAFPLTQTNGRIQMGTLWAITKTHSHLTLHNNPILMVMDSVIIRWVTEQIGFQESLLSMDGHRRRWLR